jgi:4-methyl-5(b-hydroxyethyl)-thiazole monophosphate biosynthesis
MRDKVTVILFPGAIACELVISVEILSKRLAIEVATPTGADHVDASGLTYRAHRAFSDVDLDTCRAILIAGGGLLSIKDDAALNALLRRADERRILLGAVCAGPLALAQAGVLVGHAYTQAGVYPESDQYRWDGAELRRELLVESGHIITALPEAHVDFAIAVARRLGVFDDDRDAEIKRGFYKGRYDRDWSKVGPIAGL